MQIDSLNIVEDLNKYTGEDYTKDDVKEAFDDVMDFIWKGKEFKTGKLKFSEDGKSHFADCVPLFWLDTIILIVSTVTLIVMMLFFVFKKWEIVDFFGFSPIFYSGILSLLIVSIIGVFGIIDFDELFKVFHQIFFKGKENWLFDPKEDEVILILPEEFFMYCASLMGSGLALFSFGSIGYGIVKRYKLHKMI